MNIEKLDRWLSENGFGAKVEFHGYTNQGWLWVADITTSAKPAWFKMIEEASWVENIRGWGRTPDESLLKVLEAAKGKLIKKEPSGEFLVVPDFL